MLDGIKIMERMYNRGALVEALDKPWLDLTKHDGQRDTGVPLSVGAGRAGAHRQAL
jgi:hypothetical protein